LFTLRVLEAAVRRRSYSAAARDLAITQGAVSQHIRKLEAEFGTRLFFRSGNEMIPGADTHRLAGAIRAALGDLQVAVDEFAAAAEQGPLVVSMDSRFQGRWLSPRLSRLLQHPAGAHLDMRVEDRVADFINDGMDVGIRFGRGDWDGLQSVRITSDRLCVVCSPEFAESHSLRHAEDLLSAPLIHDFDRLWPLFFERHRLSAPQSGSFMSNSSLLTVDAVLRGLGAAIVRYTMVESELRTGRLVRPVLDILPLPTNYVRPGQLVRTVKATAPRPPELGYFAAWRPENRKQRRIETLVNWLRAEAAESDAWLQREMDRGQADVKAARKGRIPRIHGS
jgi:LysR family transcriptional regulator, glycine cleavage system transcriptional activator